MRAATIIAVALGIALASGVGAAGQYDSDDLVKKKAELRGYGMLIGAARECEVAERATDFVVNLTRSSIDIGEYGDPDKAFDFYVASLQRGSQVIKAGYYRCSDIADKVRKFVRDWIGKDLP